MIAEVMVDITGSEVDRKFDYYFDCGNIFVGSRVTVPFGNRNINGIVVAIKGSSDLPTDKIKKIQSVFEDIPALTGESLALAEYIERRYHVSKALALRLFLPGEMRQGKVSEKIVKKVTLTETDLEKGIEIVGKKAKKQVEILKYLSEKKSEDAAKLNSLFGRGAVLGLAEKNLISIAEERTERSPYTELGNNDKHVELTVDQKAAVNSFENTDKAVTLLHGVTGSGKTEVYLKIIENSLLRGKTAIMLVPEIALTPQMLRQLRARFGGLAAIFHSGLSAGEKFDEWWRLRRGEAKIVIGARSAVFSPVENVGVIIIDEEHDTSYISEKTPRYTTLDMALFRANYNKAKIIVGSATPSVETYKNALDGEYNLAVLKERVNKKPMPEIIIADMRKEIRRGNNTEFSSALKEELAECLKNGNQAMIFLNRRGYSQYVICTECGYVPKCESCDVSLTYHYDENALKCHYCGAKYKMITECPECGGKFLRYGVSGTQKVVMELQKLFPTARILRMDNDTVSQKDGHFKILSKFAAKEADILVGTQMIAKGHDFSGVTLVGILDADMSLHFSDYRSGERTFQLITQVAGRSGRAEEKGKVVLQTYSPQNYILGYALRYDYEGFFNHEISVRSATKFPPFAVVLRVLITSSEENAGLEITKCVYEEIKVLKEQKPEKFIFANCMKAPIKRIQNKFRFQILMRLKTDSEDLLNEIYYIAKKYNGGKVTVSVEENPNNLN